MPSTQTPAITIQKRAAISFNTAAFEALGKPRAVELLYDREEQLIAIKPASASSPNGYVVRGVGKSGATHVVSGKAFLNYYGIPFDAARRWTAELQDDMLVIDLKGPGADVTGHSSRAHRGGG
jgi:hypothetical protein